MLKKKFVSVIVPTYNHWEVLKLCINALEKQSYPKEFFEVIVVNNDKNTLAPPDLVMPSNFVLLDEEKPGSYTARNKGIQYAKGEIIAFTDADCIPDKDWIKNAVRQLECGSDRVAGRIEIVFQNGKLNWLEVFEKVYAFNQDMNAKNGVSVTANLVTWKKYFEEIGLFDDRLMSGGDFDWNDRATQKGIGIDYADNVLVLHPPRSSSKDFFKKIRRTTGGLYKLKEGNHRWFLKYFILGYLPPIRNITYTLLNKKVSLKERLIAIFVYYCVIKCYRTSYMMKLYLFNIPLERE